MSVQIVDVRMSQGRGHDAISHYQWTDSRNGVTDWADRAQMVAWVRRNPNKAWVAGAAASAWITVVDNPGGQPYLRSYADNVLTDNLLSLPGARAAG